MTKREREKLAKLEAKRAKDRERWHKRTKSKTPKAKAYKERKAKTKARWQRQNSARHAAHVQAFYERWGISTRAERAEGKSGAVAKKRSKRG